MDFKKCTECGCESFTEFAKIVSEQKGVRIEITKDGSLSQDYEKADGPFVFAEIEPTGYRCDNCEKQYRKEFAEYIDPGPEMVREDVEVLRGHLEGNTPDERRA